MQKSALLHTSITSSGRLVAELVTGGDPLPPSILDELMCNSTLTGVLFSSKGVPLWQGYTKRSATAAQLKALRARDQGCIGCGANPVICQAHHVMPWSKGGRHRHNQHGPRLLELSQQDPSSQLASHPPARQTDARPTQRPELRTRSRGTSHNSNTSPHLPNTAATQAISRRTKEEQTVCS